MEKVKITICDREYNLKADESAERITRLAGDLEKQINSLKNMMTSRSELDIVTLVALNILDDADKARIVKSSSLETEALKAELIKKEAELVALKNSLDSENKNIARLNEGISSAEDEMLQLARVKDEENQKLRAELVCYEETFDKYVNEYEDSVKKLKESYSSANGEMEQIADVKDSENSQLRARLLEYENTLDEVIKQKEDEIIRLQQINEQLKSENAALKKEIAELTDDGQTTLC